MRLLIDTHAFLWFILNDASLSTKARSLIADPANDVLISPASYWEMAIKVSLGKYHVPGPFGAFLADQIRVNDLGVLPIEVSHAAVVATLPMHHRDPFDRLLVAQAIAEGLALVSADPALDAYGVTRM